MLFLFKYSVFFVIFISPFYLTIAVSLIEFFPQFFYLFLSKISILYYWNFIWIFYIYIFS